MGDIDAKCVPVEVDMMRARISAVFVVYITSISMIQVCGTTYLGRSIP